MNQHIYLTGYRGTGKSTVGKFLADVVGLGLIDLDDVVEQAAGKTIREIFGEGGEESFRDLESECLDSVAQQAPAVVALGGGAILRQSNRKRIAESGVCIWLIADAQTLADRIAGDATTGERRPAFTSLPAVEEIREMLSTRDAAYRDAADFCIETAGKSPQGLASEILERIRTKPKEC